MHKILFVDDEPAVLEGYRRMLRREFEVETAAGGEQGLLLLAESGPYSVVVSDMRMPGMNGAQFLARARESAPDTVRMLLTGYTDIDAAVAAVNEGNIFRFLAKPCEKDVLAAAINAGCRQYDLVTGEKDLLEKTLLGSIRVMADVLHAANPEASGRSISVGRYMRHMAKQFVVAQPWRLEAAATLSQLGCLTLDPDLLHAAYAGSKLSDADQARFEGHPLAAMQLLQQVPRLEAVAWIVGQQMTSGPMQPAADLAEPADALLAAKMLRMSVIAAGLRRDERSDAEVVSRLRYRHKEFDAELLDALADLEPETSRMRSCIVPVHRLAPGMILDQEIRNQQGVLLVGRGQHITQALTIKLENFLRAGSIAREITVSMPV